MMYASDWKQSTLPKPAALIWPQPSLEEECRCHCSTRWDIFQQSLDAPVLPLDWRRASKLIFCAFKEGEKHLAENYGPISLISVTCKPLKHIICHRLWNYFDEYKILTNLNPGTGFPCGNQFLTTTHGLFSSFDTSTRVQQWGTVDAEIKDSSVENAALKGCPI